MRAIPTYKPMSRAVKPVTARKTPVKKIIRQYSVSVKSFNLFLRDEYVYISIVSQGSGFDACIFSNPYIRRETFLFPFIHGILLMMIDTMEDSK